ncbi:hypothetical protein [Salibacterium halotolerans]|uniref:hypothetical protein n=1 Tax=Salibacterium halotolerans TaxID=1884432 RepID=UPI0014808694|nr:hypothetical protein [Salibacterium halotolerans]
MKNAPFVLMVNRELVDIINKEHGGIYAYPHESEEDREETRRLMKEVIRKDKEKAKQNS